MKLFATILILSLLLAATCTSGCGSCGGSTKPNPSPKAPPANPFCPRDTLKLGVCADVLGLVNIVVGTPPTEKCCALLEGLADLEVAACLCTAIKANVLGINLNIPIALSALVSACQKTVPTGFKFKFVCKKCRKFRSSVTRSVCRSCFIASGDTQIVDPRI